MYILYVDHSGEVGNPLERYFVMGAVAVFERQIYFIKEQLEDLQKEHLPDEPATTVEFHASVMRNHSKPPWNKMPQVKREELMLAVYDTIVKAHSPGLCLFGQAIEKDCVFPDFASRLTKALEKKRQTESNVEQSSGDDKVKAKQELFAVETGLYNLISPIIARGFEGLCTQFEFFLRRFYDTAHPQSEQRGLLVFDHASYEKDLQLLLEEYRTYGTRAVKLYNIVEAPFYTGSASTRMLQIADFVSYAIYRRYESKDTRYFDVVSRRFDEQGGIMHGLSHVTSDHLCTCPACLTRTMLKKKS